MRTMGLRFAGAAALTVAFGAALAAAPVKTESGLVSGVVADGVHDVVVVIGLPLFFGLPDVRDAEHSGVFVESGVVDEEPFGRCLVVGQLLVHSVVVRRGSVIALDRELRDETDGHG
jgi:hypothetical protein